MLQEFVESKVLAMLSHLWQECQSDISPHQHGLAARDAIAYSLLWSTGLRGINAKEVCCTDFWLPATRAEPCQPAIATIFTLPAGSKVELVPQRLKTSITANSASLQLVVQTNVLLDPLQWMHIHLHCSADAGSPVHNVLLRPETKEGWLSGEVHGEQLPLQ